MAGETLKQTVTKVLDDAVVECIKTEVGRAMNRERSNPRIAVVMSRVSLHTALREYRKGAEDARLKRAKEHPVLDYLKWMVTPGQRGLTGLILILLVVAAGPRIQCSTSVEQDSTHREPTVTIR